MLQEIRPPPQFDAEEWAGRWDRMQERYLVGRAERFAVMVQMIRATLPSVARVLDLGCGPGSLMLQLLEAFPTAQVVGVDFDPTMLLLARARLARFGERAQFVSANLREPTWSQSLTAPFDAAVSATALHWLSAEQLVGVYLALARLLRPGGLFLNADHAGSDLPSIQREWEKERERMLSEQPHPAADDWRGFWQAYGEALGVNVDEIHERMKGGWSGDVEQGQPLVWQLDVLRASGFRHVDCFWRCAGDAVYGGILSGASS